MRFDSAITPTKSRLVLLLSGSLITLSLVWRRLPLLP